MTFGLWPSSVAGRTVEGVNTSTVLEPLPAHDTVAEAVDGARLLAVVADPVRWRLLAELFGGTRCVCTLQAVAGVSAPAVSHHLRVLREAGLVTATRRGRWIDYNLVPDASARMAAALPAAAPPPDTATRCPDGSEPR